MAESYNKPNPECTKCGGVHVNVYKNRNEECPMCWNDKKVPKEYQVRPAKPEPSIPEEPKTVRKPRRKKTIMSDGEE